MVEREPLVLPAERPTADDNIRLNNVYISVVHLLFIPYVFIIHMNNWPTIFILEISRDFIGG